MRGALDSLYQASGVLAAGFLVLIAVAVLLQVGANAVDGIIKLATGGPIGLVIPSYAEFTGFFLAAASFLALAHTLKHGAHIRVGLVIGRLPPPLRRLAEAWCCLAGAGLSGYFAWYTLRLVLESWEFHDLSTGMVPVPLWVPQASMTLGLAVLTIAFVDELVLVARGRTPGYQQATVGTGADR